MTRVTIRDLVDAKVLGFKKGLKKWMRPLLKISYRIMVDDEPDYIYLVREGDEKKMRFNRKYIELLARVFRDCDWSLASPNREHKEEVYRDLSVLVITIDKKHYVILAPYKQQKQPEE
jgi:ferredoxin-fold anticodon binding domain-containing protein